MFPGWVHQLHRAAAVGDLGRAGLPRHQPHSRHSENQQVRLKIFSFAFDSNFFFSVVGPIMRSF